MKKDHKFKNECRSCGCKDFVKILDLGKTPLANAFLKKSELKKTEKFFPLALYFCKNCSLVQLRDVVSPDLLFKNYPYLTSASKPLADHFVELGQEIAQKFIKSKKDLVVEIGSNDGVLLAGIKNNCRVLGVDPAKNIAPLARERGVESVSDYFNPKLAEKILNKKGKAKVVIANNVMAHIDDIRDIFKGVKILLGRDGIFIFEVHWVGNLIGDGGFDQIYHEHLSYYSLTAAKKLVELSGLNIFDVELIPIHGESLRIYAGYKRPPEIRVNKILMLEKRLGLHKLQAYQKFAEKVQKVQKDINFIFSKIKLEGKTIACFGAPAKGNTLLNFCGLGSKDIIYIVDSTPSKQGLYTPGTHILVCHPDKFKHTPPDYMLLLSWNYKDVILNREQWFSEKGGRWIIPVPQVKII